MSWNYRVIVLPSLLTIVAIGAATIALKHDGNSERDGTQKADQGLRTGNGSGGYTNRLANAESPYLRMHADNPVDWYPWGEEAFEKAREEDKPIFLSVGYSTCHWCHVMERKSFMDPEIAKIMNERFINVKVDREERPDVDRVYMTFVQATTGHGGWPMSVWLTPDLKPFFGGTYFPPESQGGRPGFKGILKEIGRRWEQNPDQIIASSEKVTEQLKQYAADTTSDEAALKPGIHELAYDKLESSYDAEYGGFGGAPKFPRAVNFSFLLRHYDRTGKEKALEMVLETLRAIAKGGIRDHLGGGFHRYAVDHRWHVPHFEKMLYNQAQLICSYLEAYQITDDPLFADVAREILEYVQRDMTGKEGQLYSAEGADSPRPEKPSEHAEGAFYVWQREEVAEILGKEEAEIFNFYYGVEEDGNVQRDPHGEFGNRNVLYIAHSIEETANRFNGSPEKVRGALETAREKLFQARSKRPRPNLDDKTLTSWTGLMISAFARAHQVLGDEEYLSSAERAVSFVRQHLYEPETRTLLRRYRSGESGIDGYAEDYAFFIQGLLDLYEAGFDVDSLQWAITLQKRQDGLFWDDRQGGYFDTTGDDASILLRLKEDYDGATPTPSSVSALNLLRLAQMTDNEGFRDRGQKTINAFSGGLTGSPRSLPKMLVAHQYLLDKPKQIIIAGNKGSSDTEAMLRAVHERFIPNKIVMLVNDETRAALAEHLPFVESVTKKEEEATAYICEDYVCQQPTARLQTMEKLLAGSPNR